jgi:hypothetical protein
MFSVNLVVEDEDPPALAAGPEGFGSVDHA